MHGENEGDRGFRTGTRGDWVRAGTISMSLLGENSRQKNAPDLGRGYCPMYKLMGERDFREKFSLR